MMDGTHIVEGRLECAPPLMHKDSAREPVKDGTKGLFERNHAGPRTVCQSAVS